MTQKEQATGGRVLVAGAGEVLGALEAVRDRFMIDGAATEGRFALLQHLMPAKALAAPMHLHTNDDEFSFVLQGRVGARLGDEEVYGAPGDLIFKPRGQWHTFWNAGDEPAIVLEIISPGGFERAFREMHALGEALDAQRMTEIAARYGCTADFETTMSLIERHGLSF